MKNLSTILDWIRYSVSELTQAEQRGELIFAHGTFTAFDEAHALVLGLLQLPFNLNPHYFLANVTEDEKKRLKEGLRARIEDKKPVPYITQRMLFMDLEFYVDERVLIPRSPIAEMILDRFADYFMEENEPLKILDLCCGSGCIGIAAAYMYPEAQVLLTDIDVDALNVAEINIERHDIADRVQTQQSDLFENLSGETFDLIITNPPYVDALTVESLPDEFLHEPAIALGSGHDGLDLTRRILREAIHFLNPNGLLVLEVGASWDLLEQAFPDVDFHWHIFRNSPSEGVLVMTYEALLENQARFQHALN